MEEPRMIYTPDPSIRLFDEDDQLIGTIVRPVSSDAVGPGRQTVYLVRAPRSCARELVTA